MFPPYLPNLVEVTAVGEMPNGDDYANVFYVLDTDPGAWGSARAAAIAAPFEEFFSEVDAYLASGWSLSFFSLRDRSQAGGAVYEVPSAAAGAASGDPLPGQIALAVTWRTAQAGRRYRGRTYLGGFSEANSAAGGFPSSTMVTAIETSATDLIADLAGISADLQVLSRVGEFSTEVTSAQVDSYFDTIRRRGRA